MDFDGPDYKRLQIQLIITTYPSQHGYGTPMPKYLTYVLCFSAYIERGKEQGRNQNGQSISEHQRYAALFFNAIN